MKTGLFTREIDHAIETIATFLALDPRFEVTLVISGESFPGHEHDEALPRLMQAGRVRIIDWHGEPEAFDLLWFNHGQVPPGEQPRLRAWADRAAEVGLLSLELYGAPWRRRVKETLRNLRRPARTHRALVRAAAQGGTVYLFVPTGFYPIYVHPQFLNRRDLLATLRETLSRRREVRPLTFAFVGNRQPEWREKVLRSLRQEFAGPAYHVGDSADASPAADVTSVFWIEYGAEGAVRGLDPRTYLAALEKVDFSLCPFGWGRWSHRVVESLIAGAIPILEEEASYNCGLRDDVNCLVVRDGDWVGAVRRANALPSARRREIRGEIHRLREAALTPEAAAFRCLASLGL
jgi:hypothetical protein